MSTTSTKAFCALPVWAMQAPKLFLGSKVEFCLKLDPLMINQYL